jgi:hypothetical protein
VPENRKFKMWLREDGIVQLVWAPKMDIGHSEAIAAIDSMVELTHGSKAPLLVDARGTGSQDRRARVEFVRRGELVSAVALIVDTPLSRMMANFYLNVSRPVVRTRLFEDERAAVTWLRGVAT